ncbi:MAG: type I-G CRISPR-associated protein Csb2 [Pyrinomonadaceae bacterium]
MLIIGMTFLTGRFNATPHGRHVNEGVPEYPPSPYRLVRTLYDTWKRKRPDWDTKRVESLLEQLSASPPSYHLPAAGTSHTRSYLSENKKSVTDKKLVFDAFVTLSPRSSVLFKWDDVQMDEQSVNDLEELLSLVNFFGRSESWVSARVLHDVGNVDWNCSPVDESRKQEGFRLVRLACPVPKPEYITESLQSEIQSSKGNKATTREVSWLEALSWSTDHLLAALQSEPPALKSVSYLRRSDCFEFIAPTTAIRRNTKVQCARYELESIMLPPVQDALPFAEQVRRALIRRRDDESHSEAITGKTFDGVPLEGHAHAHYLATDEDGDGRLDHVTVYAARGFERADVDALGRLSKIFRRGNRPDVRLVLVGLGTKDEGQFSNVSLLQPSRRWRSVTPFVLPRFATRGAGKRARLRDTPIEQLKREARVRGLPEIISVEPTQGYQSKGRPLVRWLEFVTRRFNGSTGYGVAGFEIEFAEEVCAPLALGFGCHFGLGLFEALPDAT